MQHFKPFSFPMITKTSAKYEKNIEKKLLQVYSKVQTPKVKIYILVIMPLSLLGQKPLNLKFSQ